jgi:hypothetical protein
MTLQELSDITKAQIEILNRPTSCRDISRWYASFESSGIKCDSVLTATFGNGNTPEEALENYADSLRGKTLVIGELGCSGKNRREFIVPVTLTAF